MVSIIEKEEQIQKLEKKLTCCNDGKCKRTRKGFIHLSHSKNKLTWDYQRLYAVLLIVIFAAGVVSIIETDDGKKLFYNSAFLGIIIGIIGIVIGVIGIWSTKYISERQMNQEKWSRYSLHATLYFYDKEWDLSKDNYIKSLEFISDDIHALHNAGAALSELERYVDAIPYFKKVLEVDSENVAALTNMAHCYQNIFCIDDAIKIYEKGIKKRSKYTNDVINNLGSLYLQECQYDLALEQFEKAIVNDPNNPRLWTNKATTLNFLNKYEEALLACNRALKIEPKYTDALIEKSDILHNLKRYEEVLHVANLYLKLKPFSTKQNPKKLIQNRILFQMSAALFNSRKYEEALQCFNEYLAIVPDNKYALMYKGHCLESLKKIPDAIDAYNDSLKIDSEQADVLSSKASVLWDSGRFVQALLCLEKAIRIQPTFFMAHYLKVYFFSDNEDNSDIVEEAYQQALQNESKDIADVFHKAKLMIMLDQRKQAIELLDEILEKEPKDPKALELKSKTFREQGKYDDAILICDRILELFPNQIGTLADKGLNFASKEDYEKAIKIYNKALQIEPKNHRILLSKGVALTSIGYFERAIQTCFNVIIEQNPVDSEAIYRKGQAFLKQKKFNKALDCQSEVIEINPDFYGSYFERGNCFYELGRYEEAINEYHISKSLAPKKIVINKRLSSAYEKINDYPNAWKYWYDFLNKSKIEHTYLDDLIKHVNKFGIHIFDKLKFNF